MQEELKKIVNKRLIMRIIIAVIVAVGAMVLTKGAIFTYLMGPKPLDPSDPSMEGKYVSYEIDYLIDSYVEEYSKNTKTNVKTLKGIGYVAYNMDTGEVFGAYFPANKEDAMDKFLDDSWNRIEAGGAATQNPVEIRGEWQPITGTQRTYFNDSMKRMQIDGETGQAAGFHVIEYYINSDKINGTTIWGMWVSAVVFLIAIIYSIYVVILVLTGKYYKEIEKYLENNSSISQSHLDADFAAAKNVDGNIWAGKRWTVFVAGIKVKIIENSNLVWAYYYRRTGRHAESKVRTFDKNKREVDIDITSSGSEELLKIYGESQPQMITGYDKELDKVYRKDFQTFLTYRYNEAQAKKQEESFGGDSF